MAKLDYCRLYRIPSVRASAGASRMVTNCLLACGFRAASTCDASVFRSQKYLQNIQADQAAH